jgi:hypothetical protein
VYISLQKIPSIFSLFGSRHEHFCLCILISLQKISSIFSLFGSRHEIESWISETFRDSIVDNGNSEEQSVVKPAVSFHHNH